MSYKSWPPRLIQQLAHSCTLASNNNLSQPLIHAYSTLILKDAWYCDILRSLSKLQRNLSTLPILLLHGAHLWPNVATLDGRVNLRDVLWNSAVMENTFFQVARWSTWSRKRPGERDHQLHNKLPIDLTHITSYHWQIMKWHYKLQSTTNFFFNKSLSPS